jgi:hypothetical protein
MRKHKKAKFKVGDRVVLKGCPYDEQIAGEVMKYARLKDEPCRVLRVEWVDDGSGWQVTTWEHRTCHEDWFKRAR